jgi:phosphonate transport system substrate-binding protein
LAGSRLSKDSDLPSGPNHPPPVALCPSTSSTLLGLIRHAILLEVQSGTFEAGALNEQVWARRVAAGTVDLNKVKLVFRTPGYRDYHWIAGPKTDERFGNGFSDNIKDAFLTADADVDGAKVLNLLGSKKFIPTNANNYKDIEKIGRTLGLIR